MFCPNCGKQVPDGSAFCPDCGAQQTAARQPAQSASSAARPKQQNRKRNILLTVVIVVGVYLILQIVNAIVNDGEPPVKFLPNRLSQILTEWIPSACAEEDPGFSTEKLPTEEDFTWFYDRETDSIHAKMPEGAEIITDPEQLQGGWMVFILRRPMTDPYCQYWNMDLRFAGHEIEATQYWSGAIENGQFEDWCEANTNPFEGVYDPEKNAMHLTDEFGCELNVIRWFTYEGRQYGLGNYTCVFPIDEDEPLGFTAFCRP